MGFNMRFDLKIVGGTIIKSDGSIDSSCNQHMKNVHKTMTHPVVWFGFSVRKNKNYFMRTDNISKGTCAFGHSNRIENILMV